MPRHENASGTRVPEAFLHLVVMSRYSLSRSLRQRLRDPVPAPVDLRRFHLPVVTEESSPDVFGEFAGDNDLTLAAGMGAMRVCRTVRRQSLGAHFVLSRGFFSRPLVRVNSLTQRYVRSAGIAIARDTRRLSTAAQADRPALINIGTCQDRTSGSFTVDSVAQ